MSITRGMPCGAPSSRYAKVVPPTVTNWSTAASYDAAIVPVDYDRPRFLFSPWTGPTDGWLSLRGEEVFSVMRYEGEILV